MAHKSPITTHVLDTTHGVAARGVKVRLEQLSQTASSSSQSWEVLADGETNEDGRCTTLLPGTAADGPHQLRPGVYRLEFHVKEYFEKLERSSFFPFVHVVFEVPEDPNPHYHIPLLLSPYSYSTYRGT
ncbi:uncharacterized protein EV422DRAFT_501311 [Fimicolochytrium jonesii]|uniref:uncharacterized protein n=1 Tax=Fimicolochytrium jonesii TaxID=1396493 RepID=UPI0022FEFF2C|nr:uncharacterized protein EV422DRAFT_501311 [Fimicolochytrium jonesii]KAI8816394.1 hypothetical protein EV422DRAFT_501311 [Fimicolochytrium jonesii]